MLINVLSALSNVINTSPYLSFLVLVCAFILYHYLIFPFFLSPLRKIPGPYLHRVSYLPWLNGQRRLKWIQTVHLLHLKYGDVVILSPNEISVNGNARYLSEIYTKNFPKSKFYENFRNHGFRDNIFASLENDRHLKYKKMIMNLYSKSAILSKNNPTRNIIIEKVSQLVDQIHNSSVTGNRPDYINAKSEFNEFGKGHLLGGTWFNPLKKTSNLGIDVYSLFGSLALDVVSSFELGAKNCTDLLLSPEKRRIIISHRLVASMGFWTTLMPKWWNWAASKNILEALEVVEDWQLNLYERAENNAPRFEDGGNLTTLEALKANGLKGKDAYSFLSDNIFAGHETTAIQMTYLTYELSRPVNKYRKLRLILELRENFGNPKSKSDLITDLEKIDKLSYLNALFEENSRVHTSIPGAEPRVVDRLFKVTLNNGEEIVVPKGTVISCQPYSIHRDKNTFPDPYSFNPERWLQNANESDQEFKNRIQRQQKFMMPFGKGIRMCLGMHLALIEMKAAIANIYWHFNSELCKDWCLITDYKEGEKGNDIKMGFSHVGSNGTDEEKMVMVDTYTTKPVNDECWLEWYDNEKISNSFK